MNKINIVLEKLKKSENLHFFKSSLEELFHYYNEYYEKKIKKWNLQYNQEENLKEMRYEEGESYEKLNDEELIKIMKDIGSENAKEEYSRIKANSKNFDPDELINSLSDNMKNPDEEEIEDIFNIIDADSKNEIKPEYKVALVSLNFTYTENREPINQFFKLIENGADLHSAEFDIAIEKEIFLSIVDHYNKTYWEIKFKGEDYDEAVLLRDRLIDARETRRKNLFNHLALDYTDTMQIPEITDSIIIKNMQVEYKKRFPDEIINFKTAEDWLHFNHDGVDEHPFFLKDLTEKTRMSGQIIHFKYDDSTNECHMKIFYIGDENFYMPEIKFPVTDDDMQWLRSLVLNIDRLRDQNIYYIVKEETQMVYYDFSKDSIL